MRAIFASWWSIKRCQIKLWLLWLVAKQVPAILIYLAMSNFLFCLPFLKNLANGHSQSQNSNWSSILCAGDDTSLYFSPRIFFPFHLFPLDWKTHIVSFLETIQSIRELFADPIKVRLLKFYKKYLAWTKVVAHLASIFQVDVSPRKTRKKRLTLLDRCSSSFHRDDRTVSDQLMLVTDDLEKM